MTDINKQLTIKTNSVKRIHKEVGSYEKEVALETEKLAKKRSTNAEAHEIKRQEAILEESRSMVPDAKKRLQNACDDLSNFITQNESEPGLDFTDARAALQLAVQV
eukprot:TRINITY_DN11118_c0_g1_i1.p1 TRINITY_DN11118_c0_g1~~TRINITY_DN11118_c0_g1_i1.p1  ORF type:complete len:106 (+),score=36.76 TRINITY_DN11118_c0_g1_i1:106-423(+)